ncbi:SAC domain-containing protein [Artemisia annua]|uniref:SAC domain-containing protein n=1 Tax=Artemisia annua TaxID=35608 RepID=A0A2U1NM88_ARTAN|nr:SAC domain-containing protein [Artemisia annua]
MPPPVTRSKSPSVNQLNHRNLIEEDMNIYDYESDGDDMTEITGTSPENSEISIIGITSNLSAAEIEHHLSDFNDLLNSFEGKHPFHNYTVWKNYRKKYIAKLISFRPLCSTEYMSLDNETRLDPPGLRVKHVSGLVTADYFAAGYFVLIESASGSAPPLSMLAPLNTELRHSYWRAPAGTTSAELIIVLGNLSYVSGVVLLESLWLFHVQIWASNKIHKEERSCVGKWEVRSLITSSPKLCVPEESGKEGQTPRHIRFDFRNPVRCRMIWITLSIQKIVSNSVSFGINTNLLSLDEDALSRMGRRASIAGTSESNPCIHAKKIYCNWMCGERRLGRISSRISEHASSIRNWLEKDPLLNRYKLWFKIIHFPTIYVAKWVGWMGRLTDYDSFWVKWARDMLTHTNFRS